MMGNKTLREIRETLREAFAKTGRDAVQWLEEEMRRSEQKPKPDPEVIRSLERLRDTLAKEAKKPALSRRRTKTGS